MTTLVLDASAMSEFLLNSPRGEEVVELFADASVDVHVPELCLVETASVLRKWVQRGEVPDARARQALDDLAEFPAVAWSAEPLLGRIWDLRDNFTAYDATYVALAEGLDGRLVTGDARLARAVAEHAACPVHQIA